MAFDDVFDPADVNQVRQSMKRLRQVMTQELTQTVRSMTRVSARLGGADNVSSRALLPTPPSARKSAGFSASMKQTLRKSGTQFKNFMSSMGSAAYLRGINNLQGAWDKTGQAIKTAGDSAKNAAKWMKEAAKAAPGAAMTASRRVAGGAYNAASGAAGMAGRGIQGVGKAAMKVGMFGGGSILGFMVSAFREAVANYEQTQRARLDAAVTLGPQARFSGRGAFYGYNAAEAARVQAQGAKAGIRGRGSAEASFQLMRVLGQQGLQMGGGIMAMGAGFGRQRGGVSNMMKTLEKSMALAMETGLQRARLPEYMQAIQGLTEEQIRTTPDKADWGDFAKELAFMQARGGPRFKGRFAGAALTQAGQAIRGATGPAQSFMMRAFGFGQGASLIDVLKRQERGGAAGNIMAVMQQLQKEYGAGEGGGLSSAGKLAFKGMGMGSIHMAEKFSKIYLERQKGTLTAKEARDKIAAITDEEKTKKLPSIQREAYKNMSKFGDVVRRLASRFDAFAKLGAENYHIMTSLDEVAKSMLGLIRPVFDGLAPFIKELPKLVKSLVPAVYGIFKYVGIGLKVMSAYFKGGPLGGFKKAAEMYEKLTERKTFRIKRGKGGEMGRHMRSDPLIRMLDWFGIVKQGGVAPSALRKKPGDKEDKTPKHLKGAVVRGDLQPIQTKEATFYVPSAPVIVKNQNPNNKVTIQKEKQNKTRKRVRPRSDKSGG
jgi:hypothetical protein